MVDKICKDQPSSLYIGLSGPNIITSLVHCIQSIHTITCAGREGRNGRVEKEWEGLREYREEGRQEVNWLKKKGKKKKRKGGRKWFRGGRE